MYTVLVETLNPAQSINQKLCGLSAEHRRISLPRLLAECRKRRLKQGSFVLLCFVLFAFSGLCLVSVMSVFDLSSVICRHRYAVY